MEDGQTPGPRPSATRTEGVAPETVEGWSTETVGPSRTLLNYPIYVFKVKGIEVFTYRLLDSPGVCTSS